MIIVRYADDAVLGFQHREEAERFLADLQERVRTFGLELHPDKTRLIEFGRYAAERRAKRGESNPETFDFPGYTHICGKNHESGYFMVLRKTIGKRMAAKLKAIRHEVLRIGWWQLRRRSQRSRWNWSKFKEKLGVLLPEVEILPPSARDLKARYPEVRFAFKHPNFGAEHTRQEPRALVAPARVCAGGVKNARKAQCCT